MRAFLRRAIGALICGTILAAPLSVGAACVGDCNGDAQVSVDDLLLMINIALGNSSLTACSAGNPNGDDTITIDEILTAVNAALTGCAPDTTATPSPTPTVTPLPTASSEAAPLAARAAIIAKTIGLAPVVVSAIVAGVGFGNTPGGAADAGGTGPCPGGGTATRTGSLDLPPNLLIQFAACTVPTASGSVTFDGSLQINIANVNVEIAAVYRDGGGTATLTAMVMLTGAVSGFPTTDPTCALSGIPLRVTSGSVTAMTPLAGSAQLNLQNTTLLISDIVFGPDCAVLMYRLTFDGPAVLLTPSGQPESVNFDNLAMAVDESSSTKLFELGGGVTADCFGGSATLATVAPLSALNEEICPTGGTIEAGLPDGMPARLSFLGDTSVQIDLDENGTTDLGAPNCLDDQLLTCVR